MPNVIRIVARSTMIEQYLKHCSEDHFEPLSRSTLFRILQVREASQRKSLQGLDNIAAGGAEAFESVRKIVDDLKNCGASGTWCDEVQNKFKSGKRYLKTEYRVHCREKKAYVLITADILLLVTYKIQNSANIVRINIKCAVSIVSN